MNHPNPLYSMCREHFNEPILIGFDLGRLVGYAEDDRDCYLIIRWPNNMAREFKKDSLHTCVGGYYFLDKLADQNVVVPTDVEYAGQVWNDLDRLDRFLELNGCPKALEFKEYKND